MENKAVTLNEGKLSLRKLLFRRLFHKLFSLNEIFLQLLVTSPSNVPQSSALVNLLHKTDSLKKSASDMFVEKLNTLCYDTAISARLRSL